MKQTTVALIFEKFNLLSDKDFKSWMLNNYDELFEMEKEQIMDAHYIGYIDCRSRNMRTEEQYYTETFKSE
jgi:hypothetical protein